jgi:3-oxo-5alpha-steroid 4-dehydrogenase
MTTPNAPTWFSNVEAAQIVAAPQEIPWTDEADFVVVGYGGAGVAAALEAAERGASVIALDRYHGGGATAMNGGVFYAGGGTAIQRAAGADDTPDDMFNYLRMEVQGVVSDTTLRRFCNESATQLDWMMAHGVKFNSAYFRAKTSYPTQEWYLYHSDNSLAPAYSAVARPAPRGHRVYMQAGNAAVGHGVALYQPLRDAVERLGVKVITKADARQLVLDQAGRVLGAKILQIPPQSPQAAEHDALEQRGIRLLLSFPPAMPGAGIFIRRARKYLDRASAIERTHRVARFVRARNGVCLSAGGYIFNRPMVAHYAPKYIKGMPLGSPGDDGSGIRLGQTAGGAVDRMSHISAWRFINPPLAWAQGIIVDGRGERYVNEMLYGASIGLPMCEQRGGRAFLILDWALRREAWQQLRHGKMLPFQKYPAMLAMMFGAIRSRSLEGLAARCGFDKRILHASVDAYNHAAAGAADPFGKAPEDVRGIGRGPYMAIDMSIDARLSPLPTLSLGGLLVDEETGQVITEQGRPIAGLYAAGRNAIGICSNIYVSGLSASDCIFSGRRAGAHAASQRRAQEAAA